MYMKGNPSGELRPVSPAIAELSRAQRLAALLICCAGLFIVGLDVTVVNVALPAIDADLDAGIAGLQWTVDAYTVVLASLLVFWGSVADRVGRRRTLVAGLAVFSVGSLLCALAPSVELLVAFRVLQGIGGAILSPVAVSIIANVFTDPRERAQALGLRGAVFGIAMALGPIVGGGVVFWIDWRAVFYINVPLGLLAIALTLGFIPESRAPRPRRFDPVGQVLVLVLLTTLTYGIIEAPTHGWSSPPVAGALAAAVLSLGGLLAYEPRRREPLIELSFFRSIPFSASIVIAIAAFAAFGGFLFLTTLYLQQVRGLSALHTGLCLLPTAATTIVASPLSGRLVGARGPRVPLVTSGVCTAVACAMLAAAGPVTPLWQLLGAYGIFGIGFGLVNAPITNAAVAGMPRAQAGVASAIAASSRQVGHTLGVAVVGALATSLLADPGSASLSLPSQPGWWTLAACGAAIVLLGYLATTSQADVSARRTAAKLNPEALADIA